jgi:FMN phosphatase YigB (HAD superfamily)
VLKALIFDLGGTIVPFDFRRGYAAMEPLCAYPAAEIPARIRSTDLVRRFETGQIEPETFVEELCRALELRVSYAEFCDLWTSIFLPEPLIPEAVFAGLRRRYPLVLLSNTNDIHFQMIRRSYPLLDHFDHFVLSYQVGALKPSPRIYEEAVARAGCRAEECFFTDDVAPYVEGARLAGLDAVRFESYAQLESELRSRGVF